MQRRANLSKPESYYFAAAGMLGALTFLYGAYELDETAMDLGKNLMIHAVTVYFTDKPVYRVGSLFGAVSSFFSPPVANAISAGTGILAIGESWYKGDEVRGLTF